MTLFVYNRDIPAGPHNPSVDQPDMKTNTNSVDDLINVDHVSFGLSDGGNHRQVRMETNQAFPPGPGLNGGVAALYSSLINGNAWPVWQNALGHTTLVTGPTNNSINGFVYLPGRILLQWGNVTKPSSTTGTVTFNTPFIVCLNVSITMTRNTSVSGSDSVWIKNGNVAPPTNPGISAVSFDWKSSSSMSSNGDGFFWIAIGTS